MRPIRAIAIVLTASTVAVLAACSDGGDETVDSTAKPEATATATPWTPIPGGTIVAYEGPLGDFIVTPGSADNDRVCDEATVAGLASGLEAAFPEREVFAEACSVSVAFDGGFAMVRSAFTGELHVPFEANEDDLELVTVGGRPGLVAHPPIPQLPPRAVILERMSDGQPGILIELTLPPIAGSLDEGFAYVEQLLSSE